jgi:hypothetical protein
VSDVDLDRLADFLGGALDGTPDEALVRHLVASDPAWARAAESLTGAQAAVTRDLRGLAAAEPRMPADVTDRIMAALAAAGRGAGAETAADVGPDGRVGAGVGVADRPPGHPQPRPHDRPRAGGPSGPGKAGGPSSRRPGARQRRRRRTAVVAAAVAAAAAVGGVPTAPGRGRRGSPPH